MKQPPVRLCCMKRHYGPVCDDKKVLCAICFERYDLSELAVLGDSKIDVCKECWEQEGKEIVNHPRSST